MKHGKWLALLLTFALAVSMAGLSGCASDAETGDDGDEASAAEFETLTPGRIIVGSDTAYPPFENDEGGEIVGFDVDLMKEIGDRLGYEVEFKTYKFDALIAGMQAGTEFDMIASAMTIKPDRAEKVDFSDPYINSNQSLAVAADSAVDSWEKLAEGDKVGVQSGTTGEIWANENLAPKGVVVTPYDDILAAFGALSAGDVAGIVNDAPISQDIVKDPARNAKVVQEIQTDEQYGFAFNQDNDALREAVNEKLAEVKGDGTYVEIYKKWFGAEPLSIP
ncbi:MAG: basic amino acid ABC transporter substrate-binding protein [Coriobacteriia bacterium]|nr:basic amino acid ABC transporter substrate-binding protein [Coriobacteriia bacterium]